MIKGSRQINLIGLPESKIENLVVKAEIRVLFGIKTCVLNWPTVQTHVFIA